MEPEVGHGTTQVYPSTIPLTKHADVAFGEVDPEIPIAPNTRTQLHKFAILKMTESDHVTLAQRLNNCPEAVGDNQKRTLRAFGRVAH